MSVNIILASTSPYRRALLQQLKLPFECQNPFTDEALLENETAANAAYRLAGLKAQAVASKNPDSIVIGSDQLATCEDSILGKPGSHEQAIQQLQSMAGKTITFHTGLCVIFGNQRHQLVEAYQVQMRPLTSKQIENYLLTEQPYNCAGSFKSEGLGITLFNGMQGKDPNTLIGLPLISLTSILNDLGQGPLGG
ncbi:MAG TPA: septum formation inhibitor Maf [Oceanospirillaceae bacterium]|nr:septum formation inhibitor Maf [Oceanospirillaceae bacterium]